MSEMRRTTRVFGQPEIGVKIYDRVQQDAFVDALCSLMENRGMPRYAFAGVAHIYTFSGHDSADFQLYGREGMEDMDHVFPYSVNLRTGEEFPPNLGRACLDETIIFGKEAELFKEIWKTRGVVDEETAREWLLRFAA